MQKEMINYEIELPWWATQTQILEYMQNVRLKRDQKDQFFYQLFENMLERIEFLEDKLNKIDGENV